MIDHRRFLRCMDGYGLILWRLHWFEECAGIFERTLSLNPTDSRTRRPSRKVKGFKRMKHAAVEQRFAKSPRSSAPFADSEFLYLESTDPDRNCQP